MATFTPVRTSSGPPIQMSTRNNSSCLSRSPKRVKSALSPIELSMPESSLSSPSTSRTRSKTTHRPALEERKAESHDHIPLVSSWSRRGGGREPWEPRDAKREMSVPSLSHSLSAFSLSQNTSPSNPSGLCYTPTSIPFSIPSPSTHTATPRRHPILPLHASFEECFAQTVAQSEDSFPALHYLGSPFSTKNSRQNEVSPSPIAKFNITAYEAIPPGSDWKPSSEWIVEEILDDATVGSPDSIELSRSVAHIPYSPFRPRRDTFGSASSLEEFSGSSSTSLYSLARGIGEQHRRAGYVSFWETLKDPDAEGPEIANATSRRLFSQSQLTDNKTTSIRSSLGAATSQIGNQPAASPITSHVSHNTLPIIVDQSPNLLLSRFTASSSNDRVGPQWDDPDPTTSPPPNVTQALELGLGLGISTVSAAHSNSFSSSSGDEMSPSKPPIRRNRSNAPVSPLGPPRTAVLPRRRTLTTSKKPITPLSPKERAFRPQLRRGLTEPRTSSVNKGFLSPAHMSTPPSTLFSHIRPSPAAFASTGLVKKRSSHPVVVPSFGEGEPLKRFSDRPVAQPVRSRLGAMVTRASEGSASTNSTGSEDSVSMHLRGAQKTRGLRRKTSSMFGGSISSLNEVKSTDGSPSTPTRPGLALKIGAIGRHATTPSPTTPSRLEYPFAPSSSFKTASSPLAGKVCTDANPYSPVSQPKPTRPNLLRLGPVVRASNPMLSATYKSQCSSVSQIPSNRLATDFVIQQSLGKGEFSQVWSVQEKLTGNIFAVKAGRPYTGVKNRLRQLEEVSILHELSKDSHPHILPYVDSWEHSSRLYIRTALAPSGDLSKFLLSLAERGGLDEARSWKVLEELSSGLAHIHASNFLHLDMKPSNILITASGSLQIADFGLSTILSTSGIVGGVSPALPTAVDGRFVWEEGSSGQVPVPSPIMDRELEGDREYLCPEALEETVGKEADVYSLGIMLLEAALNVVLPSNGDGWVKLRSDDFSDLDEHYTMREPAIQGSFFGLPIISIDLLNTIKGMMRCDPKKRLTLDQVRSAAPILRIREGKDSNGDAKRKIGAALVEEHDDFVAWLLV